MTGTDRYRERRYKHLRPKPAITEKQWQEQVVGLAARLGWQWLHVRSSMYGEAHFLTATSGTLGKGWPDLLMVKPGRKPLAVELKRHGAHATPDQIRVLADLSASGFETHVWWPSDFDVAARILSA